MGRLLREWGRAAKVIHKSRVCEREEEKKGRTMKYRESSRTFSVSPTMIILNSLEESSMSRTMILPHHRRVSVLQNSGCTSAMTLSLNISLFILSGRLSFASTLTSTLSTLILSTLIEYPMSTRHYPPRLPHGLIACIRKIRPHSGTPFHFQLETRFHHKPFPRFLSHHYASPSGTPFHFQLETRFHEPFP
jgi:hypothetical protein